MKINDSISIIDGISRMIKQSHWGEGDIKVELNAYQFECDVSNYDPQGDIKYKSYSPTEIAEAFKDFLKYVEKDYESIDLSVCSYRSEESSFNLIFRPKGIVSWTTTDITPSDKNAEKLAKIQQIIQAQEDAEKKDPTVKCSKAR